MEKFDKEKPDHHRPAFASNRRPPLHSLVKPMALMVAKGSKPLFPNPPVPAQRQTTTSPAPSPAETKAKTPPAAVSEHRRTATPFVAAPVQPREKTPPAPEHEERRLGPTTPPAPIPRAQTPAPAQPSKRQRKKLPVPIPTQRRVSSPPAPVPGHSRLTSPPAPALSQSQTKSPSPTPRYVNRFAPLTQDVGASQPMDDEDAEGSDEDIPQPARIDKGKQKEVVPEATQPPAAVDVKSQRRLAPKSSGRRRTRPCKRCARKKRDCYEQAGVGSACVYCARLKMRCEPDGDDEALPATEPAPTIPAKRPAAAPVAAPPSKRRAILTSKVEPSQKKRAPKKKPAPAPGKSIKSKPIPAPGTTQKMPAPSKGRPEWVDVSSSDTESEVEPSLRDFQAYYGKSLFFFSFKFKSYNISRYSPQKVGRWHTLQ